MLSVVLCQPMYGEGRQEGEQVHQSKHADLTDCQITGVYVYRNILRSVFRNVSISRANCVSRPPDMLVSRRHRFSNPACNWFVFRAHARVEINGRSYRAHRLHMLRYRVFRDRVCVRCWRFQVSLPEIDGAIEPIIYAGREGATGRSVPLADRVQLVADRALKVRTEICLEPGEDEKPGHRH